MCNFINILITYSSPMPEWMRKNILTNFPVKKIFLGYFKFHRDLHIPVWIIQMPSVWVLVRADQIMVTPCYWSAFCITSFLERHLPVSRGKPQQSTTNCLKCTILIPRTLRLNIKFFRDTLIVTPSDIPSHWWLGKKYNEFLTSVSTLVVL